MARYRLTRDFFDGKSMHYAGEVVEAASRNLVPSSAVSLEEGAASGAVSAGSAPEVDRSVETIVPAPHHEHEVSGAVPTDPAESPDLVDPDLDKNLKPTDPLAGKSTHDKPGSDKAPVKGKVIV